jgi:hypothetical protein
MIHLDQFGFRQAFQQCFFSQPVLIFPRQDFLTLGGRELSIRKNCAICVGTGEFLLDADDDIEDFLDFEGCFGLGGPETIFGGVEFRKNDSLVDVF